MAAATAIDDGELPGEGSIYVLLQPGRSWEYPLTRAEKMRRLVEIFEAEVETRDNEIDSLRSQTGVLTSALIAAQASAQTRRPYPEETVEAKLNVLSIQGDCVLRGSASQVSRVMSALGASASEDVTLNQAPQPGRLSVWSSHPSSASSSRASTPAGTPRGNCDQSTATQRPVLPGLELGCLQMRTPRLRGSKDDVGVTPRMANTPRVFSMRTPRTKTPRVHSTPGLSPRVLGTPATPRTLRTWSLVTPRSRPEQHLALGTPRAAPTAWTDRLQAGAETFALPRWSKRGSLVTLASEGNSEELAQSENTQKQDARTEASEAGVIGQGGVAADRKSSNLAPFCSLQTCIRENVAGGDVKLQSMDDKLSKIVHDTQELKDSLGAAIAAELMFKLRDMLSIHHDAFKVGEGSKGKDTMNLECTQQDVPGKCDSEVAAFGAAGSISSPDAHQVTEEWELNVRAVPSKSCQQAGIRRESTPEKLDSKAVEAVQTPALSSFAAASVASKGLFSKRKDLADLAASIAAAADAAASAERARLSMKRALADAKEGAAAANLWERSSTGVWRRSTGGR
eukprot:TRINITY_DN17375_c0_g1_i2.p1 TRINITY_DN17375_c0_g1~~TRINITY_DN17375_c0_g1_i2.p1  ORF type:complete len:586 (+),score=88.55 TRINITY_DN17375_c0_g1_i2:55-1758(+)